MHLCAQDVERQAAISRNAKRMTAPKTFPRVAMDLATTVERIQQNFTISDPSLPDCPIVFASDSFLELTGYPRHEVSLLTLMLHHNVSGSLPFGSSLST